MPRRPSFSWGRDSGITQDPVHAGNRELQALVLGQHLGEVVLVESHVRGFGQLAHPGRQRWVQGMDRAPSPIAMGQGGRSFDLIAAAQSPDLANRDPEQARRLGIHQGARLEMVQNEKTALFRASQCDLVPLHGRTKSQNHSGRTKSQNYNTGGG